MKHNILEEINKDQRKLKETYREIDKAKKVLKEDMNKLRMCEVNNVLEFVKLHLNKLDSNWKGHERVKRIRKQRGEEC